MVKVDLHNHLKTRGNFESEDFGRLINSTYKKLGAGGVVGITTCMGENTWNYEKFLKFGGNEIEDLGNAFYVPKKNILVIKSEQVVTKQGHLLVVGLKKCREISHGKDLEDTIKIARDENCLVFANLPFYKYGVGSCLQKKPKLLESIDGIEIHNGEATLFSPGSNKKSQCFYSQIKKDHPDLVAISTSDGHSFFEIGSSYTEIPELDLKNSETIIKSLKENLKRPLNHKMHNSYLGALRHGIYLSLIIKLMDSGIYPKPEEQNNSLP
jgi:hypothetical protein